MRAVERRDPLKSTEQPPSHIRAVVVVRGRIRYQKRLHVLRITKISRDLPALDPMKCIHVRDKAQSIIALPCAAIHHRPGERERIQQPLAVREIPAYKSSRIV